MSKHLCGVDSAYSRRWLRPAALWSGRADGYKLALWCCDALKAWQSEEKNIEWRRSGSGCTWKAAMCLFVSVSVLSWSETWHSVLLHAVNMDQAHTWPPSTCVCESLLPRTHSVILQSQSWLNCWQLMIQWVSRCTINWITGLVGFSLWRLHLMKTIVKL